MVSDIMDYCDEINDVIIDVLNEADNKIGLRWCDRDDIDHILLEYTLRTLRVHDIILDEIMDRIEHY